MKKVFILAFLLLSSFFPKSIYAGSSSCDLIAEGTKLDGSDLFVVVDDHRTNGEQVTAGRLFVYGTGVVSGGTGSPQDGSKGTTFTMNNGSFRYGPVRLNVGNVTLEARELGGDSYLNAFAGGCSNNPSGFTVRSPNDTSPLCEVTVGDKIQGSANAHQITFNASNLPAGTTYHAYLDWRANKTLVDETFSGTSYSKTVTSELTPPPTNQQDIINGRVTKDGVQNTSQNALCNSSVTVSSDAKAISTPIPPPVCQGGFCLTALGKIPIDPTGFIKSLFGIILSLAGGVAIILIMISGYRLMSSQGNPEKVQAAREQLTSAIVGLLFIIFSVTILQIIGVDILHIPGFTR